MDGQNIMEQKKNGGEFRLEQKTSYIVQFLIRAVVGMALIFFINQFLASRGISQQVGLNPVTFTASGFFGAPGVALLYGIAFYTGGI